MADWINRLTNTPSPFRLHRPDAYGRQEYQQDLAADVASRLITAPFYYAGDHFAKTWWKGANRIYQGTKNYARHGEFLDDEDYTWKHRGYKQGPTRSYGKPYIGKTVYSHAARFKMPRRYGFKRRRFTRRRRVFRRRYPRFSGRKSIFPTGRMVRTGRRRFHKRRFKYGKRTRKALFKTLLAMQDKNVYREITSGQFSFNVGSRQHGMWRVYRHSFLDTTNVGGGATNASADWGTNSFLQRMQVNVIAAGSINSTGFNPQAPRVDRQDWPGPGAANDAEIKVYMKPAKMTFNLRNNGDGVAFLSVYVFKAKIDIPSDATPTTETSTVADPFDLWTTYLGSNTSNLSNVVYTAIEDAQEVKFSDAKTAINHFYKTVSFENVKLNPGEEYRKVVIHPARVINIPMLRKRHYLAKQSWVTNPGMWMFKGEYLLYISVRGDIVHDDTVKNNVNYGGFPSTDTRAGLDYVVQWDMVGCLHPTVGRKYFNYYSNMPTIAALDAEQINPAHTHEDHV